MKGSRNILEAVPTLYFSVVTGGNSAIFGHKFFIMAQGAYVLNQLGSLLHLLMGNYSKRFLCKSVTRVGQNIYQGHLYYCLWQQ